MAALKRLLLDIIVNTSYVILVITISYYPPDAISVEYTIDWCWSGGMAIFTIIIFIIVKMMLQMPLIIINL